MSVSANETGRIATDLSTQSTDPIVKREPSRRLDASHIMVEDPFFALRARAYDLADTGRYKSWAEVAKALQDEGGLATLISRLDRDAQSVMMLTRCCDQARA